MRNPKPSSSYHPLEPVLCWRHNALRLASNVHHSEICWAPSQQYHLWDLPVMPMPRKPHKRAPFLWNMCILGCSITSWSSQRPGILLHATNDMNDLSKCRLIWKDIPTWLIVNLVATGYSHEPILVWLTAHCIGEPANDLLHCYTITETTQFSTETNK